MGALRPLAGLLDEGATRASGCLVAVRDCSAFYPLLPAPRCALAVLLVVAKVLGPSPRHRRKRNQPGPAESSRITAAVVRLRPAKRKIKVPRAAQNAPASQGSSITPRQAPVPVPRDRSDPRAAAISLGGRQGPQRSRPTRQASRPHVGRHFTATFSCRQGGAATRQIHLTPPNRAGWLRPLTRRGTQNQHPAWSGRTRRTASLVLLPRHRSKPKNPAARPHLRWMRRFHTLVKDLIVSQPFGPVPGPRRRQPGVTDS